MDVGDSSLTRGHARQSSEAAAGDPRPDELGRSSRSEPPDAPHDLLAQLEHARSEMERAEEQWERYRELFEAAPEAYLLTDPDGVIQEANEAAAILLQAERDSLAGSSLTAHVTGPGHSAFLSRLTQSLEEEGDRIIDWTLESMPARGRPLELAATVTAVREVGGALTGMRWMLHRIDKYRQNEAVLREQTEFVINLYEALAHPFYVVQADDYTVRMANSAAFPDELPERLTCYALTHRRDSPCPAEVDCPLERVRRTKQPAVVEHVHYDQHGDPRLYEVHGYPTFGEDGNVIQMISYALDITERRRTEEALQESEARTSVLFNNSHSVMLLIEPTTAEIVDANAAACAYYGYDQAQLTSMCFSDLIECSGEQTFQQMLQAKAQHLPLQFQQRLASGAIRDVELYFDPIRSQGRQLLYAIVYDVTERKRVEEATRRQSRELMLINRVSRMLTSTLDLDEVLATVLQEACRLLDVVAASVWLLESETQLLVCKHATGPAGDLMRGQTLALGVGCVGHAALTGASLTVADTSTETRCTELEWVEGVSELRSIAAVPLRAKEDVIGALEIADRQIGRFEARDVSLIESLAATAAIAIDNARLYAEARHNAETRAVLLREVNHRVKNNLSTIIGLMYAERGRVEAAHQDAYQATMKDLTNRVYGLARVHSMLSSSQWAPLRLSDLASEIIRSVLETTSLEQEVIVDVSSSPVRVSSDQAHDLALVINELATNAIKYAVGASDAVRVTVRIGGDDGIVSIEFRDNGPGYPDDV
ncbi:MAG: PAS domain S-box protein, partial [Anaerolineales bacterium]|nr:PAS domain S-box protein [Anaerolineales bacterium]